MTDIRLNRHIQRLNYSTIHHQTNSHSKNLFNLILCDTDKPMFQLLKLVTERHTLNNKKIETEITSVNHGYITAAFRAANFYTGFNGEDFCGETFTYVLLK
jgi:hypothetical protein